MHIHNLIQSQREFFNKNTTKDIQFRKKQLKTLKRVLKEREKDICDAVAKDFDKSAFETIVTELLTIHGEINTALKKLNKWSKKKKVKTSMVNIPAISFVMPEPLGNSLIISAWNYPYQLAFVPAISAIAAGNTVILKPSEIAPNSSAVIADIVNNTFEKDYFHVIEGGVKETTALLKLKFDKIFFTGNKTVGKIVYEAAAKHLTPVTLELGGKSPAFIFEGCNINMAAQRLVWAKFLNSGQTCVAPDYVLVEKKIEIEFLEALKNNINKYYKLDTNISDNYTNIINVKHFERLASLIDKKNVFIGGNTDKEHLFISPTILRNIDWDSEIMKDEIFGPILPIITFNNIDETINIVKSKDKPLACYIYSKKQKQIDKILTSISFGGGCINDSLMHLANNNLPFGGVGGSGMGSYHGEAGFKQFSHFKSILKKSYLFESSLKYFPYTKRKINLIKRLV